MQEVRMAGYPLNTQEKSQKLLEASGPIHGAEAAHAKTAATRMNPRVPLERYCGTIPPLAPWNVPPTLLRVERWNGGTILSAKTLIYWATN